LTKEKLRQGKLTRLPVKSELHSLLVPILL